MSTILLKTVFNSDHPYTLPQMNLKKINLYELSTWSEQ